MKTPQNYTYYLLHVTFPLFENCKKNQTKTTVNLKTKNNNNNKQIVLIFFYS